MSNMQLANEWESYELMDTGGGEKLERWGTIRVIRPDPQIIWPRSGPEEAWQTCHMRYNRSKSGGGHWEIHRPVPAQWTAEYKNLRFHIRPTDFKHMGLFPEQAVNWQWAMKRIQTNPRLVRVLNLFAYTGGATLACLAAGAEVTHVDAAKGMNQWAKDNIALSGLTGRKHRVITDDVLKFVQREYRRNSRYDVIIMDPPSFGRGPSGEVWKLEDRLFELVESCAQILTEEPLFLLLNAYTAGFSPQVAANILTLVFNRLGKTGVVSSGELGLPATHGNVVLPCGLFGRWEYTASYTKSN